MPQTLLKLADVSAKTSLGRSAIYARTHPNPKRPGDYDPTFPLPVKVGGRGIAWYESEINEWIASRADTRKSPRKPNCGEGRAGQ